MIMPSAARLFTTTEAAAVSGVGVKAVNNAIDKKIVRAARPSGDVHAKGERRALTADDLLHLKLWYQVGNILSQDRRRELFDAILARPNAKTVKAGDLLIVDVEEARRQIAARTRDLEAAEAMVSRDKAVLGGEPVFKGTRIPVRLIASMLDDGADAEEILEGYPKLAKRHLELAHIWIAAHPRRGRPKSLKARGLTPKSSQRVSLGSDPRSR
jgi:uncharacterized protein (DUF433 family)